jgi:hypothetical protein
MFWLNHWVALELGCGSTQWNQSEHEVLSSFRWFSKISPQMFFYSKTAWSLRMWRTWLLNMSNQVPKTSSIQFFENNLKPGLVQTLLLVGLENANQFLCCHWWFQVAILVLGWSFAKTFQSSSHLYCLFLQLLVCKLYDPHPVYWCSHILRFTSIINWMVGHMVSKFLGNSFSTTLNPKPYSLTRLAMTFVGTSF